MIIFFYMNTWTHEHRDRSFSWECFLTNDFCVSNRKNNFIPTFRAHSSPPYKFFASIQNLKKMLLTRYFSPPRRPQNKNKVKYIRCMFRLSLYCSQNLSFSFVTFCITCNSTNINWRICLLGLIHFRYDYFANFFGCTVELRTKFSKNILLSNLFRQRGSW